MDLSIYAKDFTQHDLFGLFPGAPGGRALRDMYGRVYLVTIATKGGQTTLERYGKEYMRELARENAIPIVQDIPLARLLHRKVKVGREIPASTYKAVAAVLAFVYRVTGRTATGQGTAT